MEETEKLYVSGNVPGEDGAVPSITADELRLLLMEVLGIDGEEDQKQMAGGEAGSVSGNGADAGTVSGNGSSVSDNSVSDNSVSYNGILTDIYTEVQTLQKEEPPIWEKPLEDYTVTEGLLLIMFLLLLGIFASHFLKGGEKYV